MRPTHLLAAIACASLYLPAFGATPEGSEPAQYELKIERQPLGKALQEFAKQSGVQIIFFSSVTEGFEAPPLRGRFTATQAVATLLNDTKLTFRELDPVTIEVRPRAATQLLRSSEPPERMLSRALAAAEASPQSEGAQVPEASSPSAATARTTTEERSQGDQYLPRPEESGKAIPEMLVKGRRSINADIERTEDDVQPYIVFSKEEIRRSLVTDLEEFLVTRLPMNASRGPAQRGTVSGAVNTMSSINLRGLGTNQTLVLVNGRRVPSSALQFQSQGDINSIPLAAIERIEVLPATASGIYGGNATGGVVNIVTRQDYAGLELSASYDNSFESDSGRHRFDLSGGMPLGEATHVTASFSYSAGKSLLRGDRDFVAQARALQLANNPAAFFGVSTPPSGYTTNMRNAAPNQNAPLQLDPEYGGTVLSSPFTFVPVGYAGIAAGGAAALVANAGQYNLDLPGDFRGTLGSLGVDISQKSGTLNLRHSFGSRIEAFIDASWLNNYGVSYAGGGIDTVTLPANAPNNPFTTAVNVRFPVPELARYAGPRGKAETLRAAGGVIVRLPGDWTGAMEYTWSRFDRQNVATAPIVGDPDGPGPGASVTTALQSGALDVVRDLNQFPLNYSPYFMPPDNSFGETITTLNDIALRASGPVLELPGGDATLSALAERRTEKAPRTFQDSMGFSGATTSVLSWEAEQQVDSYYLEAQVPVVGAGNAMPVLQEFQVQASVRHDRYDTLRPQPTSSFASSRNGPFAPPTYRTLEHESTDHTLGLRFSPIEGITLRASMGTGFLAPTISQVQEPTPNPATVTITDPKRGNTTSTIAITSICCSNPDIGPEDSESWSAGMIFTPGFAPGLRLSLDYTRIEKNEEIVFLSVQELVDLEDILAGRIVRAPLSDEDIALGYTGGAITTIDRRFVNIARTLVGAYDIQADYTLPTQRHGDIHFYAVATWQRAFERQAVPSAAITDMVGFDSGPGEWRGNAGLTWEHGPWSLNWNTQYYDSYRPYGSTATAATIDGIVLNQGSARIPAQMYHDVLAGYTFDQSSKALGGLLALTKFSIGIRNVFDEAPPIVVGRPEGYSSYGDPRMRVYALSIRKSF